MSRIWGTMGALCALLMLGCTSDADDEKDADGGNTGGSSQGGNGESDDDSGGSGGGDNANTSADPVVDESCATVRCAAGTHCEVTEVDCINDPCDPTVECVPDDA